MRICTSLWGGIYNPIIPVYKTPPKEWRTEKHDSTKGYAVARGYINFFEPDVYVEAEKGLLKKAGLGSLDIKHGLTETVITLGDFLASRDHRDWSEPARGLNMIDVFSHIYDKEQRFVLKDGIETIIVPPVDGSGIAELVFGVFPDQEDCQYIRKSYENLYSPIEANSSSSTWKKVFLERARTPLGCTRYQLEAQRHWYHDLKFFVFDPKRPTDLIDCWNMCLEPSPFVPVPVDWFEELAEEISEILEKEHRPVKGNPNGLMHHSTIEFGRSISKETVVSLTSNLSKDLPIGSYAIKHWRTSIWQETKDDHLVIRDKRKKVTCSERKASIKIDASGDLIAQFDSLSPEFASQFGGEGRWVNCVSVSPWSQKKIASVLPFNTFDRTWPKLGFGGDLVAVGSEGWVFEQQHKNWSEFISFLTNEEAIVGMLKQQGIEAVLSEPGHIAKQMLEQLGDLFSVGLFRDEQTLKLLNKMAGGIRRSSDKTGELIEYFENRTAPLKVWIDLIERRKQTNSLHRLDLSDFTKKNIIKLGLETECPHCRTKNWHSISTADYTLSCERCLKAYDFPQTKLRQQNRNWKYRVTGPFSVPDYARGSYGALLTIRFLDQFGGMDREMTYSTALTLTIDETKWETDFFALWRERSFGRHTPPEIIFGEAKSFGNGDLIKPKDIKSMKTIARNLPGAVIIISVLRDSFTENEKKLLRAFVKWGRRLDENGGQINPIILLTSLELFMDHFLGATWEKQGEPHSKFSGFHHTKKLSQIADATQQIYLDLPPFAQHRDEVFRRRVKRKGKSQ